MQKENIGMTFDWEVFVRSSKEYVLTHPNHFIYKVYLSIVIANVFYDCVTKYPVKLIVLEREFTSGVLNKLFARIQLL